MSTPTVGSPPSRESVVLLALATFLAVALAWALLRPQATVDPADRAPIRLTAELGAELTLRKDLGPALVLSPDGRTVVFATRATTNPSLLHVRRLNQPTATPLRATEDATSPFFSPDGKWLGFFAGGKLQRISVTDGTAAPICDAPSGRGGTWARDGSIVFTPGTAPKTVLMRVPASGGQPVALSTLLDGEITHRWPQMLPGDVGVLYTSNTSNDWNDARVMVQPLPNGTPKMVHPGFFGRYVSSGHLLFARSGTLYAAPFDIDRLEVTGPSAAIVDNVVTDAGPGGAQFAVSDTGTLVFLDGPPNNSDAQMLAWMDRAGSMASLHTTPLDWLNPQVSPDGRRVALDIRDGKQIDVWIQELSTRNLSRLTFDPSNDEKPIWSPDGEHIVFTSNRGGAPNLYQQRADGSGTAERLTHSQHPQAATSWHPSGRLLALREERPDTGRDILILPVQRPASGRGPVGVATGFTSGRGNEVEAVFSPDGRWLAYTSNETGRAQVFVRAFPQGGKWQVSNGGGRDAAWSRTRPELLFFDTTQPRIMVARYAIAGESFRAQEPRAWSGTPVGRPGRDGRTFALHPDGERVLIVPPPRRGPEQMTLIFNFSEQLGGLGSPRQ